MRAIFVGPSLSGASRSAPNCTFFPPAAQGDLTRAVLAGAGFIGLVDGLYETVAAVWHKEILFALDRGVRVLGAASMGALRAAECNFYGMEPVGEIAGRYVDGTLMDDAAVAVVHAPAELGYAPLNEALVNFEASVEQLLRLGEVSPDEAGALYRAAEALFFKERTIERSVADAIPDACRAADIVRTYRRHRVDLKQRDALLLIDKISTAAFDGSREPVAWQIAEPPSWRLALRTIVDESRSSDLRETVE